MTTSDRVQFIVGDITSLEVDAVVSAANESLIGGGGVDGAVHAAAGPGLFEECRSIGLCPEGEARLTGGYLLPAKHIIHTVGPVYEDGSFGEANVLRSAYESSLCLAEENAIRSIAFPCIATGTYGFPNAVACEIAVDTVTKWLECHEYPELIVFCCFEEPDISLYRERLSNAGQAL